MGGVGAADCNGALKREHCWPNTPHLQAPHPALPSPRRIAAESPTHRDSSIRTGGHPRPDNRSASGVISRFARRTQAPIGRHGGEAAPHSHPLPGFRVNASSVERPKVGSHPHKRRFVSKSVTSTVKGRNRPHSYVFDALSPLCL